MQLTEKNGLVINIDDKTKYYNESELKDMICFFENNQIPNGEVYIFKNSYKEPQNPVTTLTKEEYTMEVKEEVKENDMVNNPNHYGGKDNIYEAIKVIEAWNCNFNIGNAVKYLSRAGKKDNIVQDLSKAIWYINREIENLNKK